MIHQFIFAAPRPGMSEEAFQRYWVEVHAVRYASRIPQIRRYMIDTRIPLPGETDCTAMERGRRNLACQRRGAAGIAADAGVPAGCARRRAELGGVLANPGARHHRSRDPAGAAGKPRQRHGETPGAVEAQGGPAAASVQGLLPGNACRPVLHVPRLRRYVQGHVVDGFYSVGEAVLDCVEQLWFDNLDALLEAGRSMEHQLVRADYRLFTEERYLHEMIVRENWIIGPEPRPYTPGVPAPPLT